MSGEILRRALICPSKYVQFEDALKELGAYIKLFGDKAILIAHHDDSERVKEQLKFTQKEYGVKIVIADFKGECSRGEIKRLQDIVKKDNYDVVIGLGGGKALDTSKCVSDNLRPVIVCPTIAATDAPTSSSAVVYHDDHSFDDYAYFKFNPNIVLVDTKVIAMAPSRFLVSGMGDALSTYFEARATRRNLLTGHVNAGGYGRPRAIGTNTSFAMAELCYQTLLKDGKNALVACNSKLVTTALENIIEANILLSGIGFESGGLGAAHAIYNGMTVIEEAERYMHGEKVAFGTLVQLVLEGAPEEEINTVLDFCLAVGLPVCFKDLDCPKVTDAKLREVADKACIPEESIHNMPFPIRPEAVVAAMRVADKIGYEAKYGKK